MSDTSCWLCDQPIGLTNAPEGGVSYAHERCVSAIADAVAQMQGAAVSMRQDLPTIARALGSSSSD